MQKIYEGKVMDCKGIVVEKIYGIVLGETQTKLKENHPPLYPDLIYETCNRETLRSVEWFLIKNKKRAFELASEAVNVVNDKLRRGQDLGEYSPERHPLEKRNPSYFLAACAVLKECVDNKTFPCLRLTIPSGESQPAPARCY